MIFRFPSVTNMLQRDSTHGEMEPFCKVQRAELNKTCYFQGSALLSRFLDLKHQDQFEIKKPPNNMYILIHSMCMTLLFPTGIRVDFD